ncbi:UBC-like protein [Pisolithus croceorrhizus]|nr:UBC-like protein [Pisolithus croceorrhizus]
MSPLSGLVVPSARSSGVGDVKYTSSNSKSSSLSVVGPSSGCDPSSLNPTTRAVLSSEYASLRYNKHCPSGMYITPGADSILVWDGVLFVHKGYYAGSVLKFAVTFPDKYPDMPPTVRFLTDVFHPLVETRTGLLNLMARFPSLEVIPTEHRVHDILHFMKALFKAPVLDRINELDVVNKEAFKLRIRYQENRTSFTALAQQSAQFSRSPSALYDSPNSKKGYSFPFTPVSHGQVERSPEDTFHPGDHHTKLRLHVKRE